MSRSSEAPAFPLSIGYQQGLPSMSRPFTSLRKSSRISMSKSRVYSISRPL